MAEESDSGGVKLTLLCFDKQAVLQEPMEDLTDMLDVFCLTLGKDEDIIQVDKHKSAQHISKHVIDETLKNGRWVRQAKRHNQVLKMSQGGVESRLPFVPLTNSDQVIGIAEI